MSFPDMAYASWQLDSVHTVYEERPPRPEDMLTWNEDITVSGGTVRFIEKAISPDASIREEWLSAEGYTNYLYQDALDQFVLRRQVTTLTCHCECNGNSWGVETMTSFTGNFIRLNNPGGSCENIDLSEGTGWFLMSVHGENTQKGGLSKVTAVFRRFEEWEFPQKVHIE